MTIACELTDWIPVNLFSAKQDCKSYILNLLKLKLCSALFEEQNMFEFVEYMNIKCVVL